VTQEQGSFSWMRNAVESVVGDTRFDGFLGGMDFGFWILDFGFWIWRIGSRHHNGLGR
jgi:hypothetical protein